MEYCIIRTLSYFDVFDYPLTFSEIKKYLCCEIEVLDDELLDILNSISVVQESAGYYYLLGRQEIVEKRSEKGNISVQKYAKAKIISKVLSFIPTIEYIGLSGSLSMNNASISDDIDLFFVTKKNTLWLSRLFVSTILTLIGQKRGVGSSSFQDKICPNMFVEHGSTKFVGKKRSLYIAHELVQMKTLFDRNNTHDHLLANNRWVKIIFPNIVIPNTSNKKKSIHSRLFSGLLAPIEKIAYFSQVLYMRNKRSIEVVDTKRAFFHPIDRQKLILDMYEIRYQRYKKLFEDNLWIDKEEARYYIEVKKSRILN